MEVLVGPAFTIDVSSPPPSAAAGAGQEHPIRASDERSVLFLDEAGGCPCDNGSAGVGIGLPHNLRPSEDSSESSSSIGTPDESDEEEEDEVQSKLNRGSGGLGSLDSLEDSLPIKRGLSNHYSGKSKSFQDLSQMSNTVKEVKVKELEKQENPFNKRRRILIASKWSRKSSFYTWSNPKSMPLLPVNEDQDESDQEERPNHSQDPSPSSSSLSSEDKKPEFLDLEQPGKLVQGPCFNANLRLRLTKSFKSRCFSLTDLQEHDNGEEDDDDD